MNPPKLVLLTGATGLLGTFVLRDLLKNHLRIRATYRNADKILSEFKNHPDIDWFKCDMVDSDTLYEATENCHTVIHTASLIKFEKSSDKNIFFTNVEGTSKLINAALFNKVTKFIYISSVTAFPAISGNHLVDEKDNWNIEPYPSYYAWSKFLAQKEIYRGEVEGLSTLILNPSSILGPGNWFEGPSLFFSETAKGNYFYPKGSGGFIDVRDLSDIITKGVLLDAFKGQFIASAWNENYRQLQNLIAKKFNKKAPSFPLEFPMSELAILFDYLQSTLFKQQRKVTRDSIRIANLKVLYNNELLTNFLNYQFRSKEETIEWVCSKYTETRHSTMLKP